MDSKVKGDKLKVLCIHGYRQSGESLKSKLGSFRKFVKNHVEFEFVSAPHIAPPLDSAEAEESNENQKGWWFNKEDGTFKGTNVSGPAIGFEESLKVVEKTWKEGQFQGLLGFSQGACFVGLICHLAEKGRTIIKPDFVILASGFRSGSLVHTNFYSSKITIPSLHIYGETDEIIPKEMSELLASTFSNKEILIHPGGHYFPATVQQKIAYQTYFKERLEDFLIKQEIENAKDAPTIFANGANNTSDSE